MAHLPPFWHAAAQLTGRIDLQPHLDRCSVPDSIQSRASQSGPLWVNDPFITLQDDRYPPGLRPVPYCPPVLFVRGNLGLLDRPAVAIVGARRCTGNGQKLAHRISRGCAVLGGVTVSGMAYGIDQAAHLAAPGSTIAVLGQGLNAPMSTHQQRLADSILEDGGLLVSEFLPSHPAHRWTFPLRNRVIAGLGRATVIVEAGSRSGALHTARHALDAGRDVLAVPGSPLAPSSA
ncbi:MAG: DNA-processing protein DprA, partial [Myxococcota bacterium]|nr:DNA-processing protein DprA [Myxococcota bacterium]